jgi:hypothetical protein
LRALRSAADDYRLVRRSRRHHRVMSERRPFKNDLPGSRSAPCLGCGGRVVTARDPHVLFGGKRDGSLLIAMDAEPQRSYASDVASSWQSGSVHGSRKRLADDRQ